MSGGHQIIHDDLIVRLKLSVPQEGEQCNAQAKEHQTVESVHERRTAGQRQPACACACACVGVCAYVYDGWGREVL